MEVLGVVRLLAEAGVVIGQETRQQLVSGGDRADTLKAKLLDQAILQGLVGALDAALRLRCVGAQNVDVERVQRAPELGHAVTLDCPGAIDPKDAVLVAVEGDRLAVRLEILTGRLEVVEGGFRLDKPQLHQAAGGVVNIDQQGGLRAAVLKPPMHLPRYLREWSYRFNRRNLPDGLDRYLIRRAVECATITYDQLTAGAMPAGAARVRRLPATVGLPALAG